MSYETIRSKDFIFEAQRQIDVWADISGPSTLSTEHLHAQHSHVNLDTESASIPTQEEIDGARIFPKKSDYSSEYDSFRADMHRAFKELLALSRKAVQRGTDAIISLQQQLQEELAQPSVFPPLSIAPAIEAIRATRATQTRQTPRSIHVETVESVQEVTITVESPTALESPKMEEKTVQTGHYPQHTRTSMSMFRLVVSMVYRELVYGAKYHNIDNK